MPLIMPSPNMRSIWRTPVSRLLRMLLGSTLACFSSSIHLAKDNIDTAKNDHNVPNQVPQAHVFQNCQIDEARGPHAITIRIRRAVANQIKSELPLGRFDPAVSFARFGPESPQLRFRINDRAFRYLLQGHLQNLDRFAHLQDTN